jgi:hypothetical protein
MGQWDRTEPVDKPTSSSKDQQAQGLYIGKWADGAEQADAVVEER